MEINYDQNHINAREALLDVVEALGRHNDAIILVGAQAVYVHTESEDANFALSPFTYDADIVLDPELLGSSPTIIDAMSSAGFRLEDQPGLYRSGMSSLIDSLDMATELGLLRSHEISSSVTSEALSMFQDLFSTPSAIGTELVVQYVYALEDSDFIAGSSVALSQDLLEATSQ